MSAKLAVDVNVNNADRLHKLAADAEQASTQIKRALQPNKGAASAWNPYITAVQQLKGKTRELQAEIKRQKDEERRLDRENAAEKKRLIKEVADAQKRSIEEIRQAQKAARDEERRIAKMNRDAVSAGLASKWSPQIATKRGLDAAQQKPAATQANPGAASAWNPYISAVKKLEAAQKSLGEEAKKTKAELQPNPGAASDWSPYISALKKVEAEEKAAADAAKKRAAADKAAAQNAVAAQKAAARDTATAQKAALNDIKQARKAADAAARRDAKAVAEEEKRIARDVAAARKAAINDVRQAQKAARAEEQRIAKMNRDAVSAGLASKWSPQISAGQALGQANQNQALGSRVARMIPAGGRIDTFNTNLQAGRDAAEQRFGAAAQAAQTAGLGSLAIGTGGALALGDAAQAAGQWQQWEVAFTQLEGSAEGARKRLEELNQFAMTTPFSMPGVVNNARMLRAMNFEGEELVPTMRALGNAMAATGQGEDVLNRVALNLGQIRGMENPKKVDLNQFAYAGLDVKKIMSSAMGKEMSMDDIQAMSGKEFVDKFLEGLNKEFGGMLEKQLDTLPGSLNQLSDSFFRFKVAIGGPLIPAINAVAKGFASVTMWFVKLPGPIKTTVAWLTAIGTGLFILGGIILTAIGPITNAIIAHAALTGAITAQGTAAGTAATATGGLALGIGTLALSFGLLLGAIALATVAIAIAIDQWNKNKDKIKNPTETSQDNRTSREKYDDGVSTELVGKVLERNKGASPVDRYAILGAAVKKYGDLGAADENIAVQQEMDSLRKKYGSLKGKTTSAEAKKAIAEIQGLSATDKSKRFADSGFKGFKVSDDKSETDDLKKQAEEIKQQAQQYKAGVGNSNPGMSLPVGMPVSPALASAVPSSSVAGTGTGDNTDALQSEIWSLEDQIRKAKKEQKPALRDRLVAARRQLSATKKALAAEKQAAKAKEREAKKALDAAIDYDQMESDVRETEATERFNTKIAELEARRDEAKSIKDKAKAKQLAFEIESLKAQRDLTVARMNADATALEDEKKAEYMRRIAQAKYKGAMDRARIELSKKSGAEMLREKLRRGGSILSNAVSRGAQAASSAVNSGSMFNPYSNSSRPGGGDEFVRVIGGTHSEETGPISGGSKKLLEVGRPKRSQAANGDWIFKFPELRVPDPFGAEG